MNAQVAIVTFGSALVSYDGVGKSVWDMLSDRHLGEGVELIDGDVVALRTFLGLKEFHGAIIIDALDAGKEEGAIVRLSERELLGEAEDEHPLASLHDMSVVGALRMLRRVEWELPDEIIFVGVQIGVNKDGLAFYPTFDMEALITVIMNEAKRMQNAMKH